MPCSKPQTPAPVPPPWPFPAQLLDYPSLPPTARRAPALPQPRRTVPADLPPALF